MHRRDLLRLAAALPATALARRTAHGETMQDRIEHIMRVWDSIDGHRTGTTGDARTAAWLAAEIETLGAVVEIEEFSFERLVPDDPHLMLDSTRIEGLPCFDAPGTAPEGISGRLVPFGGDGEIGLLDFEPTGSGASTLMEARRNTTHRALVAVNTGQNVAAGLAVINADDYGSPFGPSVLQVATEHRDRLEEAARSGSKVTLDATLRPERTMATNVGTTIVGRDPALPPLVIMTPRSGWWQCTSERGGGLVAWLEALAHFTREPPRRTVHFTANTGHELGHVGLDHYLEQHPSLVEDAHCWVHLGANFAAAGGLVLYQASDDDLMALGTGLLENARQPPDRTLPVGTRPLGEARDIYDGGGRYVSLLGSNPLFHHPDDRWPDAVDIDKTQRLVAALIQVTAVLANGS